MAYSIILMVWKLKIPSVLDTMKNLRNIKEEWKSKSPNKKYCVLYGDGIMVMNPLHISIFHIK